MKTIPTKKYIFISDYSANYDDTKKAPRLFKKGEIIDGFQKLVSVQCIKAPCPMGTTLAGISTIDGLTIPMNVLNEYSNDSVKKETEKDVWTGGVEWDKIFSVLNFWRLVIFCLFLYLFLKHLLPLIKQSLKK